MNIAQIFQILLNLIDLLIRFLILVIFVDALLSFVLPPYHTIRMYLGKITGPLYAPIRRFLPTAGPFDFTPLILVILLLVLERILIFISGWLVGILMGL